MAHHELRPHPKAWLALAMTAAAGYVDACGWLMFAHSYTAHMSGNTVGFGVQLGLGKWTEAVNHGWPILPFMGGLLFSAITAGAARRRGFHSSFAVALGTEVILIFACIWIGLQVRVDEHLMLLTALLACAMGLQTVTVTRINGLRVYTTYITGSLSKCAEALTDYVFWFYRRTRGRLRRRIVKVLRLTPRQKCAQHAALTGGLWIFYFAGAVCGALLEQRFALIALAAPLVILITATLIDIKWPVAAADDPQGAAG